MYVCILGLYTILYAKTVLAIHENACTLNVFIYHNGCYIQCYDATRSVVGCVLAITWHWKEMSLTSQ